LKEIIIKKSYLSDDLLQKIYGIGINCLMHKGIANKDEDKVEFRLAKLFWKVWRGDRF
jgi:hypothetical protein